MAAVVALLVDRSDAHAVGSVIDIEGDWESIMSEALVDAFNKMGESDFHP